MKRKCALIFTLTAALTAVSFTGCSGKSPYDKLLDKDAPITITVYHYYNGVQQTQFDQMINEFNNTVGSEKGIIVEAVAKGSIGELADSVIASVNNEPGAEEIPDIFAGYAETSWQIDQMGMLADMKKYFTDAELSEYVDEYIQEGIFSGSEGLKIFPTAKSTEIMMLNLTDWQKFADAEGVTYDDLTTWEGIAATAEKYYHYTDGLTADVENDGKAFFGRDSIANYMNIGARQLGNEFASLDSEGKVTVKADETTLRKLWENYYVPYIKGYYTAESRYRSDDAKIGSIIALICSTTGAAYYPEEVTINDEYTYPIENIVLPVPNFEGCDPYVVQQGAGMSVIKSDDASEYASAVFLKWFTEEERNILFSINSGYLPVKKSANDPDKIAEQCQNLGISDTMTNTMKTAIQEINSYTLYTSIPYEKSADVRDFIGNYIQDTAQEDYTAASERIAAGENRDSVLEEYTGDPAFKTWYQNFENGLNQAAGH